MFFVLLYEFEMSLYITLTTYIYFVKNLPTKSFLELFIKKAFNYQLSTIINLLSKLSPIKTTLKNEDPLIGGRK